MELIFDKDSVLQNDDPIWEALRLSFVSLFPLLESLKGKLCVLKSDEFTLIYNEGSTLLTLTPPEGLIVIINGTVHTGLIRGNVCVINSKVSVDRLIESRITDSEWSPLDLRDNLGGVINSTISSSKIIDPNGEDDEWCADDLEVVDTVIVNSTFHGATSGTIIGSIINESLINVPYLTLKLLELGNCNLTLKELQLGRAYLKNIGKLEGININDPNLLFKSELGFNVYEVDWTEFNLDIKGTFIVGEYKVNGECFEEPKVKDSEGFLVTMEGHPSFVENSPIKVAERFLNLYSLWDNENDPKLYNEVLGYLSRSLTMRRDILSVNFNLESIKESIVENMEINNVLTKRQ